MSVVLTRAARQFIGKTTFEALTGRPVHTSGFAPSEHYLGEHIGLARRCEILVVAPATADFLARIANGFADDLLATLILTVTRPVLLAPSMNTEMWNKPSVQRIWPGSAKTVSNRRAGKRLAKLRAGRPGPHGRAGRKSWRRSPSSWN